MNIDIKTTTKKHNRNTKKVSLNCDLWCLKFHKHLKVSMHFLKGSLMRAVDLTHSFK